ncbi:MAG: heterodisulfide reductase-related iron-sulfur binding cluster, partial [Phascolarctobacterium succinatutens]|nr:heterodisulfide reductase-related iron-sulfur binding cluster [Phascolarctobacterium succinatutens]
PYAGETRVLHYLEVLRDEIGWEKLAQLVSHPLKERRVGAYYGCLLLRPGAVLALDDVESPTVMEAFIKALGAEPVIYSMRNECCGGYLALKDKAQCEQLVSEIKNNAASCGAQELVTACPLCAYNLTANGATGSLPTRYFTELLAEALGVAESEGGAE